jgi:hypothetical protein
MNYGREADVLARIQAVKVGSDMQSSHRYLELAWASLRLPLLFALVLIFRQKIIAAILSIVGIERATMSAINVMSTPVSRSIYFCLMLASLLVFVMLTKRLSPPNAYLLTCCVAAALIGAAFIISSRSSAPSALSKFSTPILVHIVPVLILLGTNLAPTNLKSEFPPGNISRWLMIVGLGFSELFFFWRHVRWVTWLLREKSLSVSTPRWLWALPGVVIASLMSAFLVNGTGLVPIEQAIRRSPAVRTVARGDFNWIKSDRTHNFLYAVGHGFNHVRMYNISDWSSPPVESEAPTGWTQSFAYSPSTKELYLYDGKDRKLRYFDSQTLQLTRSVDIAVSPGDTWLAFDDHTNTISVASEADEQVDTPFVVVDRSSGAILDRQNEDAGNLLLDPSKSVEYLSFFRRTSRVKIYDLRKRAILRTAQIGARAERMAILADSNELLITLPPESRVVRLNADTLESKGEIPAAFGVRAIAIDARENLLFCGSIATGELDIIDLSSGKRRARYYLGPWLRTIELLTDRGIAYVSSNGAIYELQYK